MKKINLFIGILASIFLLFACQDESLMTISEQQLDVESMIDVLQKSGIMQDRIEVKEGYFLVDGDIKINFSDISEIEEALNKEQFGTLKAYQYPNPYYAYMSAVRDIKIFMTSSVTSNGWATAVNDAIVEWNGISPLCAVNMTTVSTSSSADIIIDTYFESSSVVAQAMPCINGSIGATIDINTNYNFLSESVKLNTIVHELGHNIGFAHANGSSNFSIPTLITGTSPNDDPNAVMHSFIHNWFGFTADEVLAAITKYRETLNVSIFGPVKGDNQGTYTWSSSVSRGTGPYTYFWEYSYNGSSYSPWYTTSSVTAQLPLDRDLHLRLTVTDTNGVEGEDEHFTMNLDAGFKP